jgi:WD40 repeat protein
VRNIDDPTISKQYTAHTAPTTVARFSPSGFYIASGDITGSVRVWDSVAAESTKGEYHIIAGRINDLAWDGDSQRIIAVGDGKERFGHCFTADSGNSVGEISGHSQQITCVDVRKQRPLRAATGSDDMSLVFYHGAPFKFATSVRGKHDRFIYGTQFSPDGAALVTVGADRKIWLYDGKTGDVVKQIGEGAHTGSIFGVAWSPDGTKLVTCSGDQTVKVWEVERGECVQSWRMGDEGVARPSHQQVGVTWPAGRTDGLIISLDLDGNLNYFREGVDAPVRVVRGHQKAVTAATVATDEKTGDRTTLWTGSYDGRARAWDLASGAADEVHGAMHSNYVAGLAAAAGTISSVGWDDTLRTIDGAQKTFTGAPTPLDGQPTGTAIATIAGQPHTLVATAAGISSYTADGTFVALHALPAAPTCVAASAALIATGSDDRTVRILSAASPTAWDEVAVLSDPTAAISALAFSPDASRLAVGLANGKIYGYARGGDAAAWTLETTRWSAHTARVTTLDWSPCGMKVVSGALDTHVFVWSVRDPGKRVRALNAHKEGVGAVVWTEEGKVISCGADAAVKVWKVEGVP